MPTRQWYRYDGVTQDYTNSLSLPRIQSTPRPLTSTLTGLAVAPATGSLRTTQIALERSRRGGTRGLRQRRRRGPVGRILRQYRLIVRPGSPNLLLRSTIATSVIAALALMAAHSGGGSTVRDQASAAAANGAVPGVQTTANGFPHAQRGGSAVTVPTLAPTPALVPMQTPSPVSTPAPVVAASTTPASAQNTGVIPDPSPLTNSADSCLITYSVGQTARQFTITIKITNTSAMDINGWRLHWDFPASQQITYGWNAMVTNGSHGATATDVGLNRRIPSRASTTIGFAGKLKGWVPTPSGFTLNGEFCQWKPVPATDMTTP